MKLWSRAGVAAGSALTAGVVATALMLAGCSTSDHGKGASTAPGNVDAASTITRAADAMRQVTGMHVSLTVRGSVPNLAVTKLDGDISSTPQTVATGTATLTVGKNTVDSKFVYVDGHLYSDVAEPGTYADYGNGASIYDVSTLLDPNRGLAHLLANVHNAAGAGSEQVNGVATTKITGKTPSDDIATLAGARLSPQDAQLTPTTVWIASDGSYHLVRIEIAPVQNGTVTMTMSEWGKRISATKPV
ncbi:LppX_LprAFG lipoprotein [Mycobacterium shinjukuense]|uniref:Lipoprotein LprA n=1 Tax=Mycobacterium shinjukuense TaxID=398694 RepID=A0A7I7MK98_9MYCO|nr:LppX_LprAFG lipoprotein [Mycobacterium shinjukuense]MCV6983906.1 LppX_LprAFG lipoprotein [Mycobacterium shinjukuense]ORB61882.1 hypothetical protein BST45_19435 [Mycobacterium shinjukuense]BBX72566.1 lipoprotein LprA [Mycobacterium shinjukuense]